MKFRNWSFNRIKKFLILFLSVFFWGCNSQPKIVPVMLQAEELEVIKQTFPAIDFPAWQLVKTTKVSSAKANRSEPQIWFVKDTLFNPVSFLTGKEYHRDYRIKVDTVFFDLQKKLFTDVYPEQAVKLAGLTISDYFFASVDSIKKLNKVPEQYIAITRVVFNQAYTKACYYVTYSVKKPYSAKGEILFAEKKFQRWVLIYRLPYWTAN